MAVILRSLLRLYHYLNVETADPRTKDWLFISTPWPAAGIIAFYLYFVFTLGPRLMANRQPFKLERILQIYNVFQICISSWLVYRALTLAWLASEDRYSLKCQPVDYSVTPKTIAIARTVWVYFIVKLIDLLDTVFFVLRKKQNQVSFLHVYHHAGMVVGAWGGVKYLPGGHPTFLGSINSFVHVIMYSYYLASSLKLSKLWWKKYITQLQLTQFALILYHFSQLMWVEDCGFPLWPAGIFIPQNLFMIILFGDFYYKTYVKKRDPKETKEINDNSKTQ